MPLPTPFPVATDPTDTSKTGGNLDNPGFGGASGNAPGPNESAIVAVTEKSLTSNVVTLVIGPNDFAIGDSVLVNIGDAIFDGTFTLTGRTSTTVTYAKTHADVAGGPYTITNKAITSYVATLTIGTHALVVGDYVTVSGLSGFNGTFRIDAKAATTISYKIWNADVTSAAGSGVVTKITTIGTVAKTGQLNPALYPVEPAAVLPAQAADHQALFDTDSKGL